jgi:Zn finger protein HypA/HybF involved in hydrogenase expression
MKQEKTKAEWRKMSEEVINGLSEWREKNAKATFRAIEDEVDKRLSALRAQMIADTVMQSASASWTGTEAGVTCSQCGTKLRKKGKKKRQLQTQEGQTIELEREYGVCPKCGHGLFPP